MEPYFKDKYYMNFNNPWELKGANKIHNSPGQLMAKLNSLSLHHVTVVAPFPT